MLHRPLLALFLFGCKATPTVPVETADTDTDTDTDSDTDADADTDTDSDTDLAVPCASDDPHEPNDRRSEALPAPTSPGVLVVCAQSSDWWAYTVPPGEGLVVTADLLTGDSDLLLTDALGVELDRSLTGNPERVGFANDTVAPAQVFLHVSAFMSVGFPFEYTLESLTCTQEAYEPNDDRPSATVIDLPSYAGTLVPGDEDWYVITVDADQELDLGLRFAHADGNLDLDLVDAAGVRIAESVSFDDDEALTWYNDESTAVDVFVRVYERSGRDVCVDYVLEPQLETLICPEDAFEDNDTLADATATDAAGFDPAALRSVFGDADWFAIPVPAGSAREVRLTYDDQSVLLSLELADATGQPVGLINAVANPTSTDQTVYAEVDAFAGTCDRYELHIDDVTPDCTPDLHEPDDTRTAQAATFDGTFNSAAGDPDWFTIELADDHRIFVDTFHLLGLGTTEVQLTDAAGMVLASDNVGPVLELVHTNRSGNPQTVYAGVGATAPVLDCLEYDIRFVDIDCAAQDLLEPNGSIAAATALTSGAGIIQDTDEDVFALGTVAAGATVQASIEHDQTLGDLDLQLLGANGVVLAGAGTILDLEQASWTNTTGGPVPVYLRVWNYAPDACSNAYTFASSITP